MEVEDYGCLVEKHVLVNVHLIFKGGGVVLWILSGGGIAISCGGINSLEGETPSFNKAFLLRLVVMVVGGDDGRGWSPNHTRHDYGAGKQKVEMGVSKSHDTMKEDGWERIVD